MALTFDTVFERSVSHEDGYVNDPNDPGGETKWGISKRSYPHLNIASLTREQALELYRRDFWERLGGETVIGNGDYDGVAFQLFDFALNSGVETAVRYLQRALGVADDGHFGPVSRSAMVAQSESDIILALNAGRLDFMTRLSNWSHAGKGWARRIAQNLRYGAEDSD